MGEAIGQILGPAVGVAISPIPIIALILMLFSRSAAKNSLAFLSGWLIGLAATTLTVVAIDPGTSGGDDGSGIVKTVIGLLFLGLAVRQWRSRPGDGAPVSMPPWMATIDDFTPAKAFGLAVVMSAVNPKNLGLSIVAASSISAVGLEPGGEAAAVAVYILLASITLLVPVVGYLTARVRMTPILDALKTWLMANNATVMAVLFLVLGVHVLGDGLSRLAA